MALGTRPPRATPAAPTRRTLSTRAITVCAALVPLAATAAAVAFADTGLENYLLGFVSGLYMMLLSGAFIRWRESR